MLALNGKRNSEKTNNHEKKLPGADENGGNGDDIVAAREFRTQIDDENLVENLQRVNTNIFIPCCLDTSTWIAGDASKKLSLQPIANEFYYTEN